MFICYYTSSLECPAWVSDGNGDYRRCGRRIVFQFDRKNLHVYCEDEHDMLRIYDGIATDKSGQLLPDYEWFHPVGCDDREDLK